MASKKIYTKTEYILMRFSFCHLKCFIQFYVIYKVKLQVHIVYLHMQINIQCIWMKLLLPLTEESWFVCLLWGEGDIYVISYVCIHRYFFSSSYPWYKIHITLWKENNTMSQSTYFNLKIIVLFSKD